MKPGVTLLETIVVIALIAIFSLIGVNSINNFKKEVEMDNIVNELVSEIRLARSKSINGELLGSESEEDFATAGLPEYGVRINSDSYSIIRKCVKIDGTFCDSEDPIYKEILEDGYSLDPSSLIYFKRINGKFGGGEIFLVKENGIRTRKIIISENFIITVENM